ncbi:MAG: DUF1292 domain-containing protein [Candidatus Izimaplasma sp.]|nr:DUF1292 domain-containing protein [Candidatus Izimaplasma bacterium]
MNEKKIFIENENGESVEFEIVLTFEDPKTKYKYVVYKDPKADVEEVYAAKYEEIDDKKGNLTQIESDKERDMIKEVLESFYEKTDDE